jgi:ergothioneine biosynthesis protein EgtB
VNPLGPVYAPALPAPRSVDLPLEFIERPAGRFAIGAEGSGFCFDNETPRHDVLVGEHAFANRLVTNAEFRDFIKDRGYRESRLWLADGWARVHNDDWSRPMYWAADLETEFTLSGWQPIDPASPVCHVSQYEADAFARWSGARLPLESEWELAAARTQVIGNTLDSGCLHPRPVAADASAAGHPRQVWGDVWEWTSSPYAPYPRFKPLAGSLGEYNGKFMSNQIVVRGGSCATWASHLRATYRSFFYPHDRWQFLGIRLAKDLE